MKYPNDRKRPNSNSGSLGKFLRNCARMVHVSAEARMVQIATHLLMQPWVQRPGNTLNVKRNAMKRKRRDLMIGMAGSVRAFRRDYARRRAFAAAALAVPAGA